MNESISDGLIDWSNPDYTGASAKKYVDKYTNRPEDAGSLEGIQDLLSTIGMAPGVGEPADLLNSLIYAGRGDLGQAGLNALYAAPVLGNLKFIKNPLEMLFKGFGKASWEKQMEFYKHYTNMIRQEKKMREANPMLPSTSHLLSHPEKMAKSMPQSESYKKSMDYFLDNYKSIVSRADIKKAENLGLKHSDKKSLENIIIKLDDMIKKK
jgi:hypothetical protein